MLMILLPLLIALVGVLTYALSERTKIAEIGRIMFGCGLLVTLFQVAGKVLRM